MSIIARRVRPKIGLLLRREPRKNCYVNFMAEYHFQEILDHGGLPVAIPIVKATCSNLHEYLRLGLCGLLMVEGEDVHPQYHVQPVTETLHLVRDTQPMKDEAEFLLCRHALQQRWPILGICRGAQLLNIARGGTLYNDVMQELNSPIDHRHSSVDPDFRHELTIVPNTPLHRWYGGEEKLHVNSFHHQGVRTLGAGLQPMARAPDSLIEAFYDPAARFQIGLQFHPERMPTTPDKQSGHKKVFEEFVNACTERAAAGQPEDGKAA